MSEPTKWVRYPMVGGGYVLMISAIWAEWRRKQNKETKP